jgi:hypothetical protein
MPSGQQFITSPAVAATLTSQKYLSETTPTTAKTSSAVQEQLQKQKDLLTGTSASPIKMPPVDTSLMSPAERLKYYYQQADIKLRGYLPGGVTPNEIFKRDNNGRSLQEAWFGGRTEEKYYFGDKEYTLGGEYTTPTMGGKGTSITTYGKVEDIKPDYDRGIIQKIEEKIPIASVPITAWKEQVYLTSEKDVEKFNELISKPTSTKLINFLREKQYEYKKDLGRFNLLSSFENLNASEKQELNNLYYNLASSYSNRGTFRDVVLSSAREAEARGEKIKILGKEFQPTTVTASLGLGLAAYQIEKEVLPFTIGFAGAASLATKAGAIGRVASALRVIDKPLRWTVAPIGFGSGIAEGYKEFRETGDIKYSIAYGLGTTGGFFAGLYPKQTLEYASKPFKKIGGGIRDVIRAEFSGELKGLNKPRTGKEFIVGKRGQAQFIEQVEGVGGLKKKKKKSVFDLIDEYINRPTISDTFGGKNVRYPTNSEKIDRIRKLWEKLDKTNKKKVEDFIKLIRETAGDDIARDFLIQEGIVSGAIKTPVKPPVRTPIKTPVSPPQEPTLGGIYKSPEYGKYYGKGLYETTKFPIRGKPSRPREGRTAIDVITGSENRYRTLYGTGLFFGGIFGGLFGTKSGSGLDDSQRDKQSPVFKTPTIEGYKESTRDKQLDRYSSRFFIPSPPIEQSRTEEPTRPAIPGFPPQTPRRPKPEEPIRPIKPIDIPTFQFPGEKKRREETPYDAEVYVDATKRQRARWVTVANNVPLVTALSKGGRFVDENPSNRFRVTPQKGKVNQIIDTAWNQLSNKFREYTQKSGIKVGLKPRNYIEKRSARIDSPGERRAIPQAGRASIAGRFGRL